MPPLVRSRMRKDHRRQAQSRPKRQPARYVAWYHLPKGSSGGPKINSLIFIDAITRLFDGAYHRTTAAVPCLKKNSQPFARDDLQLILSGEVSLALRSSSNTAAALTSPRGVRSNSCEKSARHRVGRANKLHLELLHPKTGGTYWPPSLGGYGDRWIYNVVGWPYL